MKIEELFAKNAFALIVALISVLAANFYLLYSVKRKGEERAVLETITGKESTLLQVFSQKIAPIIAIVGLIVLIFLFFGR